MTQEEKQLLLKDLCTRLPYCDLWVQYDNKNWLAIGYGHERIELLPSVFSSVAGPCPLIDEIKPYLRPMSSMTDDEKREYKSLFTEKEIEYNQGCNFFIAYELSHYDFMKIASVCDWLNSHHFDYRSLIEKGLALEAPEGMYKTE